MTEVIIQAGTLEFSETDRTATGLLVPFGEECASNLGKFSVDESSFTIPTDHTGINFNEDHLRESPIGAIAKTWKSDAGIMGTFAFSTDEDGERAWQDVRAGRKKSLSAEVRDVVIQGGKAIGGHLFGGALVSKGAFPSATLLAAAVDTEEPVAAEEPVTPEALTPDEDGDIAIDATETPATVTVTVEAIKTVFIEDPNSKETEVVDATIPATLTASVVDNAAKNGTSLTGLFQLVNEARNGSSDALAKLNTPEVAGTLFAALNDVKIDGTGSLAGLQVPQYVGELWSGRSYERTVIPQFRQEALTSLTIQGYRWTTRPSVSAWAGNKANVPTSTPATEAYTVGIQRFAGGNDIAREFYDFNQVDVIASLLKAYADSYAQVSDEYFFQALLTAAGTGTAVSVPTGTPAGLGKVVQGALAVVTAGGSPSVAFVAPDVFADIVYTKKDDTLEYLSAAVGGDLRSADTAGFKIIPRATMTAGDVLVADRNAAVARELPGSPIRVSALDMVKGGVDEAVFGYIGAQIDSAANIVRIKNAA